MISLLRNIWPIMMDRSVPFGHNWIDDALGVGG
jgi:hypothetical protein